MIRLTVLCAVCGIAALATSPDESLAGAGQKKSFDNGVKKIEGGFSPAEAKPGQTVTFSITIELNEGYHTYPTVQKDKGAENFLNSFKFTAPDKVIFVGTVQDPADVKTKFDNFFKCDIQYCTGKVVYTHKAVVSPKAAAGAVTVKLPSFSINVCDEENCFPPPKKLPVIEATLKVLEGPAVPVEKDFAGEVKKALGEK
ncbi:MAG TPA: hypothetical protein VG097_17235 [Gemmata sp.]|jgi:hypothetical protein|nr:hypothetical protein [Gemmata sp.]